MSILTRAWAALGRAFTPKLDVEYKQEPITDEAMDKLRGYCVADVLATQEMTRTQLTPNVVPEPFVYRRSTTATRRFERDANRVYHHVSTLMNEQVIRLFNMFGARWFKRAYKGRGVTYYKGQANG